METPNQTPTDKKPDETKAATAPAPPIAPPTPSPPKPNPLVNVTETDPLILEYADTLKAVIGDLYKPEYDQMDVKSRIERMKIVKEVMDTYPKRSEGKPPIAPEPADKTPKVKNHAERWLAGDHEMNTTAHAFEFTMNKNH